MNQVVSGLGLLALLSLAGCSPSSEPSLDCSPDSKWQVVVASVGDRKIEAIKAIRQVTGLGLRDAKALADDVPSIIVSGLSTEETEPILATLRDAGMAVEAHCE